MCLGSALRRARPSTSVSWPPLLPTIHITNIQLNCYFFNQYFMFSIEKYTWKSFEQLNLVIFVLKVGRSRFRFLTESGQKTLKVGVHSQGHRQKKFEGEGGNGK